MTCFQAVVMDIGYYASTMFLYTLVNLFFQSTPGQPLVHRGQAGILIEDISFANLVLTNADCMFSWMNSSQGHQNIDTNYLSIVLHSQGEPGRAQSLAY